MKSNKENGDEEKLNILKKFDLKKLSLDKIVIFFLIGVFLLIVSLPTDGTSNKKEDNISLDKAVTVSDISESNSSYNEEYVTYMETKLTEALQNVEGVGKVNVIITLRASKESVINKDSPYEQNNTIEKSADGGSVENNQVKNDTQTVLIEQDGETMPYVIKELEPEIKGVIVVCQGGNDPQVINNITEAIEALFNISSYKVKVLKMK